MSLKSFNVNVHHFNIHYWILYLLLICFHKTLNENEYQI